MTKEKQKLAKMYIYTTIIWLTLIWLKLDFDRALVDVETERKDIYTIKDGAFAIAECIRYEKEYYVMYEDNGLSEVLVPVEDTYIYRILSTDEQAYIEQDTNEFGGLIEARVYVPEEAVVYRYNMQWEEVTTEFAMFPKVIMSTLNSFLDQQVSLPLVASKKEFNTIPYGNYSYFTTKMK